MSEPAGHRMWGGRFAEPPDPEILAYTSSFATDRRLLRWEVLASVAHARMLGATGIIPAPDADAIVRGLRGILRDVEAGRLAPAGPFEDVHSFVEGTLYERIGAAAGRLHTARSRNDQVVTAFRLYLKAQLAALLADVRDLMALTVERAAAAIDVILPGYTHLQPAQPVRLGHHLLAYVWMLDRDAGRLRDAYHRLDVLPLGSGALAGVNHPVDRQMVADLLGFARLSENSIDATGDRDFAAETLAALALLMVHLSRWAGELVTWATAEFGFVRLADRVAHGSSLMPHKKNPDAAELIRGRAGRVIGDLAGWLATLKGTSPGYQSDLQEDKGFVFDALDIAQGSVRTMRRLLAGTQFVAERMEAALRAGQSTATEVADYLVRKGVPFREAHALAGQVVQIALASRRPLWELPLEAYRSVTPLFEADVLEAVTVASAIDSKQARGGTAKEAVRAQLQAARGALRDLEAWLDRAGAAHAAWNALLEG